MPSTKEKFFESANDPRPYGAPLGVSRASGLSQALVDDAVDRARVRGMIDWPGGERIPAEVIDQLLAGARAEDEIAGRVGRWRS
jgi:hypothetical protein